VALLLKGPSFKDPEKSLYGTTDWAWAEAGGDPGHLLRKFRDDDQKKKYHSGIYLLNPVIPEFAQQMSGISSTS
jgi:hypothetical protein